MAIDTTTPTPPQQVLGTDINAYEQSMPALGQEYLTQKGIYDTQVNTLLGRRQSDSAILAKAKAMLTEKGLPYDGIKGTLTKIASTKIGDAQPNFADKGGKISDSQYTALGLGQVNRLLKDFNGAMLDTSWQFSNYNNWLSYTKNLYDQITNSANAGLRALDTILQNQIPLAKEAINTSNAAAVNTYSTGTQAQTMNTAQTAAEQAKFQREDILQNIQNQRKQQSLYQGNDYLAGLR